MEFVRRKGCPVCGSQEAKLLLEMPFSAMADHLKQYYDGRAPVNELGRWQYAMMECQNCGSLYQRDILNADGMAQLYDQWIPPEASFQKKRKAPVVVRNGFARQCAQIVNMFGQPPHRIHVLDYGMGWGTWLQMARAYGLDAAGLEIAPSRIQHAQSLGLDVVNPNNIQPRSYHFINAEQVFEHIPDPVTTFRSCGLWLRQGGIIRIAVPDGRRSARRIRAKRWKPADVPTLPLEHINVFTPKSVRQLGKEHGFVAIQPPFVLPATGLNMAQWEQFIGVVGSDTLERIGLRRTTTVWLQKKVH